MKVNNNEVNIDDLVDKKYMHNHIKNDIYLSAYQLCILESNGIDISTINSMKELIYVINDLDDISDELERVLEEISEFYYYNYVNK